MVRWCDSYVFFCNRNLHKMQKYSRMHTGRLLTVSRSIPCILGVGGSANPHYDADFPICRQTWGEVGEGGLPNTLWFQTPQMQTPLTPGYRPCPWMQTPPDADPDRWRPPPPTCRHPLDVDLLPGCRPTWSCDLWCLLESQPSSPRPPPPPHEQNDTQV